MDFSPFINTNPILFSLRFSPSSGLEHTSVGFVGRYTDLVGCVLVVGRTTNPNFFHSGVGTLIGRPSWSVYGSGRVCPGSAGSRSRPSDIDSGKPAFMSGASRPVSLPTFSQASRVYALLSGRRWAGTYFGRLCWSVHRSGPVCPGSDGD